MHLVILYIARIIGAFGSAATANVIFSAYYSTLTCAMMA
jgi:hypothetical protein